VRMSAIMLYVYFKCNLRFRVWGLRFRVYVLGFRVQGLGFEV